MTMNLTAASLIAALMSTAAMAAVDDTARATPNASSVAASTIQSLPMDGRVRVMGTVQRVKNEEEFTLMDATGTIDVESDGETRLQEGEKVTVIGEMEDGLMGKSIEAERVTKGFEASALPAPMTLAANNSYGTSQYNAGQYGTGYTGNQYDVNEGVNAYDYNRAAPAAANPDYRRESMNRDHDHRVLDRGYEAERPDNIEYHRTHRTQPYYKDMSMNDYNKRTETRFKGQTRLQPERGFGE